MTLAFASAFSDPDGDQLTLEAASTDSGVVRALVSASELILVPVGAGKATVTVTATDPGGLSATQTFEVTVGTPNRAPVAVGEIPDQSLLAGGRPVVLDVAPNFTDPDGDTLIYTASSSDSGVVRALVSSSELTLVTVATGTATVTVIATDPGGLSATQMFEVMVARANRAPMPVDSIPDQSLTAGGSAGTLDVAPTFTDPDGDILTYAASSSDSGVVRALVSEGELTLVPVAAGSADVTVTATDPGGLSATETFRVTVAAPNRQPVAIGSIPDQTLALGEDPAEVSIGANFSDPDGDSLVFQATSSDADVVRAAVSGSDLILIPAGAGMATVTVTATDPGGLTAVQPFRVTVTEPARAPVSPTGLHVAETGGDFIEWRWNAVTGAEGYEVQFSEDGRFTSEDPSQDVGAELTYRRSELDYDTRGYLRVRAYAGSGADRLSSAWTEAAAGLTSPAPPPPTPATPEGLAANAGEDFVEWIWRAVEGVSGYRVQYSANDAFTRTDPITDLTAEDLSYRLEDLEPGTSHYLRVRSFIEEDGTRYESDWSAHVTGMTLADPDDHGDTEEAATRIGAPSSTDAELEIAGDVDYFRFQLPSSGFLAVYTTGTTDTLGLLTGPDGLRATNDDSGEGSNFRISVPEAFPGDYYVAVSGYATLTGPYELHVTLTEGTISPPEDLRVTDTGEDFIRWSWDEVPDADGYELQIRRDPKFSEADRVYAVTRTSVRATSLLADTEYYLRVRAVVGAGGARQESVWTRPVGGRTARGFLPTDRRFNRPFWDAIAFDAYECPGAGSCPDYYSDGSPSRALEDRFLVVLPTTSPNFHIRTHNDQGEQRVPSASARGMREVIADAVEALTGEPYSGDITMGPEDVDRNGWITIEFVREEDDPDFWGSANPDRVVCGRARVGAVVGRIWLNGSQISDTRCVLDPLLRHEVGHALGFFHVPGSRDLMAVGRVDTDHFTSREEYHAQLAYELGRYRPYTSGPLLMTRAEQREAAARFAEQAPIVVCRGR